MNSTIAIFVFVMIAVASLMFIAIIRPDKRMVHRLTGIALVLQILIRAVIIGFVGLFVFSLVGSWWMSRDAEIPLKPPYWMIKTESRVLYTKTYSAANNSATDVWYHDSKGKFKLVKGTQPLGRVLEAQRRLE